MGGGIGAPKAICPLRSLDCCYNWRTSFLLKCIKVSKLLDVFCRCVGSMSIGLCLTVLCGLRREENLQEVDILASVALRGTTPAVNNRVWSDLLGSGQPSFAVLYYLNILICISHFLPLPSGEFQLLISLGMTEAIPHSGRDPTDSLFLPPAGEPGEAISIWFYPSFKYTTFSNSL